MLKNSRRGPSHTTVIAYIALFVALGGSSYAALKVRSGNIVDKTIQGRDVKPNALGGKQIKEASLKLSQIRAGQGDETAVPAETILNFPALGLRLETDGDADDDNVIRFQHTTGDRDVVFNVVRSGSTSSVDAEYDTPYTYSATDTRVVDFVVIREEQGKPVPKRALHINCGFPINARTYCVAIDVKP